MVGGAASRPARAFTQMRPPARFSMDVSVVRREDESVGGAASLPGLACRSMHGVLGESF